MSHFDILNIKLDRSSNPLVVCWAAANDPAKLHVFTHYSEWNDFILRLSLNSQVPQTVKVKYERAQTLYLLAWVYDGVIKAVELAAFAALELALKDVYFNDYIANEKIKNPNFDSKRVASFLSPGLGYMIRSDKLTDEKLPIFHKSGRSVIENLCSEKGKKSISGNMNQTLVSIRNSLAHGDPFDSLPWGSLLEIVRDLIDYMYRNYPKYS